ncbi:hypothetical protein ACFWWC_28860 [Streptomyces sp. NPDC058642]|uniref:hypothetical protein n=1 Tax=Streptomyces sp. NPDC058642 TaxID=3346572 RepID=UPI0036692104
MKALGPGQVAVHLLDGNDEAYRAVVEALDVFPTVSLPWPGALADQGLPDDWRWILHVSSSVFVSPVHLSPAATATLRVLLYGTSADTLQVEEAIRESFKVQEQAPPHSNSDGTITRDLSVTPSQRTSDQD